MKIRQCLISRIIFLSVLATALTSDSSAMAFGRGGFHGDGWGYRGGSWGYRGGWNRAGWGYGGWGVGGWGYGGYGYGAALAGAAVAGIALGALAESQSEYPYGYGYNYGYAPTRLCIANQPIYDAWGNFIRYQQIRTPC